MYLIIVIEVYEALSHQYTTHAYWSLHFQLSVSSNYISEELIAV